MINARFEIYKVKRELIRSGTLYTVKRTIKNKYGEPTNETEVVGEFIGLYHEQNSNIQITTPDNTQIRTKKIPMILCLYSSIKDMDIKPNDYIYFNDKIFLVTGIVNVQEWSIIADISLEVVDDGTGT